jgi:hypothetical protein
MEGRQIQGSYKRFEMCCQYMLTSLSILDFENFKHLIFVAQSVQYLLAYS